MTHAINCNYRTGETIYTLQIWFFFRYIAVNTLYKGDGGGGDDNNNNNHMMKSPS